MCFYIGIEDLAANALIEILQSKNGDDSQNIVTYAELEKYGAEVVHYLGEQGEKAVLILSRENTNHILCRYSRHYQILRFRVTFLIAHLKSYLREKQDTNC